MTRMMSRVVLMVGILVASAGSVSAIDYYVSPRGNDAGTGLAPTDAFRTIAKGVSVAKAGDTVNVLPGKYVERVKITRDGSPDKPITIRRHGKGEVVWTTPTPDPKRFQDQYALCIEGREYIVVEGLTFRDCKAWIVLWESNYCTIRDCTFDGVRSYNALRINNGSFNRILNCRFVRAQKETGRRPEAKWIPVPGCDYIEIFRDSHNNLVEGCTFGKITHTAVSISAVDPKKFSPTRNIVRRNTFKDPYWKCLWFHAGKHNVFEQNLCTGLAANYVQLESGTSIIRNNRFTRYRDSTKGQPDILLRGAMRMQYDFSKQNRIYNNLFYGNQRVLTTNSFKGQITGNIFQNNIFFANGQTIFLGFPEYKTKNRNFFVGNVILQKSPGEKVIRLTRSDEYTLDEAQAKLSELYRGNIEQDPKLQLKDKQPVGLKGGSPCIDAGRPLTVTASEGQGKRIAVQDALWFCDGNGLIPGDEIVIGKETKVRIVSVNYDANTLSVDQAIRWSKGDVVTLAYKGAAPDIGPFEQ